METVKPLTWEEAKGQVAKKYGWESFEDVVFPMLYFDEAVELYAPSLVLEKKTNDKLSGIITHFEHEMESTKSLLEASDQENKRLQERLEAAENKKPNLAYYQKTIVQFDLIRIDKDEFVVDPQTFIRFWIYQLQVIARFIDRQKLSKRNR